LTGTVSEHRSEFEVRSAGERAVTTTPWLTSRHSFAFGQHYQPDNTHFGLLLVSNDDVVATGTGFGTHPHRDMEIVTWVIEGSLVHQDSEGNSGVVYPGLAQRMSAGTGILHSERNDAGAGPVRFLQMWVQPNEGGIEPGYEQLEIGQRLATGELIPVASGLAKHRNDTAIRIHQRDAGMYVARLLDAGSIALPAANFVHMFVAVGTVQVEGVGVLSEGAAVRVRHSAGQRVTAIGPAEVIAWEMQSELGR
jgi:redox-sensitive bicupin YhaK (pirin superfamily)